MQFFPKYLFFHYIYLLWFLQGYYSFFLPGKQELCRKGQSSQTDIIFLEASDETLLDRYKETRRDHPLTQEGLTLMEAITEERTRLQPLRETANYVIDTTGLRSRALVLDVRFLPNPFYIDSLRQHSGLDEDVRSFVLGNPISQEFLQRWQEMLSFLIPHYQEEGKHRLVIAVGCTGGAHRSVALAEAIGDFLRGRGLPTEVQHRDLQLEQARWITPLEE